MRLDLARRSLLTAAITLTLRPDVRPACAALAGGEADLQAQYAAGSRADGGRGANALLKRRAESGVDRVGGDPMFKPGAILDAMRSDDGTVVDVSFTYPEKWTVAKGPNLDVRDVGTSDSAFLLVAALPKGKSSVAELKPTFFTSLLFAPSGKYGSYGSVDDFKISDVQSMEFSSPSGVSQAYTRMSVRFDALTYNQNTVTRQAKISATAAGGSVFVLVAGCLNSRAKAAAPDLIAVQQSFRAYRSSTSRAAALEAAQAEAERERAAVDDMAASTALDGTVGATTVGRIGFRQ